MKRNRGMCAKILIGMSMMGMLLSMPIPANVKIQGKNVIVQTQVEAKKKAKKKSKKISKKKAKQIVKKMVKKEGVVKDLSKEIFEVEDNGKEWAVHVYCIVRDHTATYNWYYVNKKTGKVKKMVD